MRTLARAAAFLAAFLAFLPRAAGQADDRAGRPPAPERHRLQTIKMGNPRAEDENSPPLMPSTRRRARQIELHDGFPASGGGGSSAQRREAERGEGPAQASEPGSRQASEMALSDAKFNFETVVQAHLAKNAPGGVWAFRDKKTGQSLRLKYLSVDKAGVKRAGRGLFTAPVSFREAESGKAVTLRFTADFSGSNWKVRDASLQR